MEQPIQVTDFGLLRQLIYLIEIARMKCSEVPLFQLSPNSVYWINPYTLQKLGKIRHKQTKPVILRYQEQPRQPRLEVTQKHQ